MIRDFYCDLDGVLVNYEHRHLNVAGRLPGHQSDWKALASDDHFYLNCEPMPDAFELWDYIRKYKPVILTGIPKENRVPQAAPDKVDWVRKHLGADVKVITCYSSAKSENCKPGDVLVDDWDKYRHRWIKKGGVWIAHRTARQTIADIKEFMKDVEHFYLKR